MLYIYGIAFDGKLMCWNTTPVCVAIGELQSHRKRPEEWNDKPIFFYLRNKEAVRKLKVVPYLGTALLLTEIFRCHFRPDIDI